VSEETRAEALEQPEYCNVCENFPCLGNHPADVLAWIDNATFIWRGLVTRAELEQSIAEQRAAEERDRREWTESVRRRLGLVAEVHRCWVWQSVGLWHWWCLRDSCGAAHHNLLTQPEAFSDALAHTRSFVPQPPEPEPFTGLEWAVHVALYEDAARQREADEAALRGRVTVVTEQVNDTFAGLLPEGMRFEWE
jgi:hypothetical protein